MFQALLILLLTVGVILLLNKLLLKITRLSEIKKKFFQRYYFILMGMLFLLQGILSIIKGGWDWSNGFQLLLGSLFIAMIVINPKNL